MEDKDTQNLGIVESLQSNRAVKVKTDLTTLDGKNIFLHYQPVKMQDKKEIGVAMTLLSDNPIGFIDIKISTDLHKAMVGFQHAFPNYHGIRKAGGGDAFFVKPEDRGLGYGKFIFESMLDLATDFGAEKFIANNTTEKSREFYKKFGGVENGKKMVVNLTNRQAK